MVITHDEVKQIAREAKKVRCELVDTINFETPKTETEVLMALQVVDTDSTINGIRKPGTRQRRQGLIEQLKSFE